MPFTVKDAETDSSGSGIIDTYLVSNSTNGTSIINTIFLPARSFENIAENETGVWFSLYADNTLFPIRINQTESENTTFKAIGSSVLSATVSGQNITDLTELITINMSITALDHTVAQVSHQHCYDIIGSVDSSNLLFHI